MKRKQLSKYLDKEWTKAGKALDGFLKNGAPEKLHRFRVQVKKLRALITLEQDASGANDLAKPFKPVKNLFRQAGIIRDNQLQIELGRSQGVGDDSLKQHHQDQKKAERKLRKNVRRHPARMRTAKKKVVHQLRPISNIHLEQYYDKELKGVAADLATPANDEALHDCRKRLKRLIYNYKAVGPAITMPFNEPYLQDVQTAVGDWHDNVLASEHFPQLKKKNKQLRQQVRELSAGFYDRATTTTELPIAQID